MRYNLKFAESCKKTTIGLDGIIEALTYPPPPNPKTVVTYQNGDVIEYLIEGELGGESIPDKYNAVKVEIGNGVTGIGNYAFQSCYSLSSVTIGNSVANINTWAFNKCTSLSSVTIPDSVTSIVNSAFDGCSSLSSFIVSPDNLSYSSTNGLLLSKDGKTVIIGVNGDVVIPDSVSSIGNWAFQNCSKLSSIAVPDSVTSIGNGVFQNCTSLSSITIPDSVTSIGGWAFQNCSNLSSVMIPDSVMSVGNGALLFCSNLLSITVGPNNPSYSSANGLLLSKDGKTVIIGVNGNVVIPDSVTDIGQNAFHSCTNLSSVTIPNSVTIIRDYAFGSCTKLSSVTIPSSMSSIGNSAFDNCTALSSITSHRISAPAVQSNTFGNTNAHYTGRNTYSTKKNVLKIPTGATGYEATRTAWKSTLLNSTKCGFHIEYE